ncbi:MAG: DMT family transporter [Clostridia bacterium]|nr:DMT family transporter [Clostridia bacterium]
MQKSTMFKGYLYSILSAVIYGCMPLMSKHIYAGGVNSISLVFFRNLFSIPLVALLAFRQNKSFVIPKKALPEITVIAIIGCCITPLLLLSSYNFMASSVATVFHFIYPAVVVLIGIIFMKQKANIKTILCVLLCVCGLCLFYTPGEPLSLKGSALAIISGITCAIYICLLSVFKYKEMPIFVFTFYVIVISSVALFFFCIFTNTLTLPTNLLSWLLCILFANLITAGAVVLLQAGTFIIGGERASILSTLEPITSIILGLLFLDESITLVTACGAMLVILASILIAIFDAKKS